MTLLLLAIHRQGGFFHLERACNIDAAEARLDNGFSKLAVIPVEVQIIKINLSPQHDTRTGHKLVVHEADTAFEIETYKLAIIAYAYVIERESERA